MWIQWICLGLLLFSAQICCGEEGQDADSYTDEETETVEAEATQANERVERVNLPAGLESVDPQELGLSESDVAKYFGNVKQLQTLNLPGSKAQILTVGFDDDEKLNLQNFEQLPISGLEGTDQRVAQSAFKQFQSVYGDGNGTVDMDGLTTLFSRNPKLDVLESLDLIPPGSSTGQQQSSSQNVETFQEEEKRVDQHIKQQIEQEERNAQQQQTQNQNQNQNGHHLQQQQQYQFMQHPNLIQQQPMFFFPPPSFVQPHPQQMFFHPFPTQVPTMHPQQFVQVTSTPQPQFVHPQLRLQHALEQADKQQQDMPPVLVQPPVQVPRRPTSPPAFLQTRPTQQQFVRVRNVPQSPFAPGESLSQFLQIRPAQPQYVQIRQKGEPRQPEQLVQVAQSPLGQTVPQQQTAYLHLPPQMQQYVTANGQVLQQFQVQPTPPPLELNYAHQSYPQMIIQNPPEYGHTSFLNLYKENEQGQEQEPVKEHKYSPSEELENNSLREAPGPVPQFDPSLYAGIQQQQQQQQHQQQQLFLSPQLAHFPVPFSTIYKQIPVPVPRPMFQVEQQIQRPLQLQQVQQLERPRQIGTHYRGRHIASVRRPFLGHGPAFGTQPPVVFRGANFGHPNGEPNSYMVAPDMKKPGFAFGSSTPRPQLPFGLNNINLQAASQQLLPAMLPFLGGGNKLQREPKPSMPLIQISRPENAMRKTNKFLEEMVHAFENKLS